MLIKPRDWLNLNRMMVPFTGEASVSNASAFGQLCDTGRVEVTKGVLHNIAASSIANTSVHRRT